VEVERMSRRKFNSEEERREAKKEICKNWAEEKRRDSGISPRRKFQNEEERKIAKNIYGEEYRNKNKDKLLIQSKNYYQDNKEDISIRHKNHYQDNKEKVKIKSAQNYQDNKEKILLRHKKYENNKLKTDVNFKIQHYLRSRFRKALKGNFKSGSAVRDLGCTVEEAKLYWENLFYTKFNQPEMTWDNWGKVWQLHHIKPFESFKNLSNPEEVRVVCHYTNQKPLYNEDHLEAHNNLRMIIT
jgi:hypothetical protein